MVDKPIGEMSVDELERQLEYHDYQYWTLDSPVISDEQYDLLVRRLTELKPDSPVLARVGGGSLAPAAFGNKVQHPRPMLSLDKCYGDEDYGRWLEFVARTVKEQMEGEVTDLAVSVSPKVDGVAAAIRYDAKGELFVAATRGDGRVGEDFTINARLIEGIPWQVGRGGIEVRGEVFMARSVFNEKYREAFSNPRNLTAGTLKQKESSREQLLDLTFYAYDLLGAGATSERAKSEELRRLGFLPVTGGTFDTAAQASSLFEKAQEEREGWDFEADGIVIKLDDTALHELLGGTAHHPRFAIAYKFQGDTGFSTLEAVEWSVSRTGTITPVATVEPVFLSGAKVGRSSLHNISIFKSLGLRLGDRVQITRRGGVIPNLEASLGGGTEPVLIPRQCPSCGSQTRLAAPQLFVGGVRMSRNADGEAVSAVARFQAKAAVGGGLFSSWETGNRAARKNGDARFVKALTWKKGDPPEVRKKVVGFLSGLPSVRSPHAEVVVLLVFDPALKSSHTALDMLCPLIVPERLDVRIMPVYESRYDGEAAREREEYDRLIRAGTTANFLGELGCLCPGLAVARRAGARFVNGEFENEGLEERRVETAYALSDDFLSCSRPEQCRDAVLGSMEHFIQTVGVDGFGHKIIEILFNNQSLRRDFYTLKPEDLVPLERMGETLAAKLVDNVKAARSLPLSVFLQSLGIDELARNVSSILEKEYGELGRVLTLTEEELMQHSSIAFGIAHQVVHGLRRSRGEIDRLLEHVEIEAGGGEGAKAGPFKGAGFVFTGKMVSLVRKEAQARVKELGGETPSGVTKDLDFLVVGDEGSPLFGQGKKGSKMLKAEKYNEEGANIRIMSETDFIKMVDGEWPESSS